ncbi:MAG: dihydroxy-acid dehydratase, partial [Gammaproteobacteria bacterium]|nr:dihydroxy-acid dehydratase [Gammaproteobacteria bacterium]
QGPGANGMPELHQLTPYLGVLQQRGYRIALITDGRMSGASGKVPAAIHLAPEALKQGPIARLRDGDLIELNSEAGSLNVLIEDQELEAREPVYYQQPDGDTLGRNLFECFRNNVDVGSDGASVFGLEQ